MTDKIFANLEQWHLPLKMKGYYYGDIVPSKNNEFDLYIPVIMPLITRNEAPVIKRIALNPSCFCNEGTCAPSISNIVETQNYITCPKYDNQEFKNPYIANGAEFLIESINESIWSLRVTNLIDKSISYSEYGGK